MNRVISLDRVVPAGCEVQIESLAAYRDAERRAYEAMERTAKRCTLDGVPRPQRPEPYGPEFNRFLGPCPDGMEVQGHSGRFGSWGLEWPDGQADRSAFQNYSSLQRLVSTGKVCAASVLRLTNAMNLFRDRVESADVADAAAVEAANAAAVEAARRDALEPTLALDNASLPVLIRDAKAHLARIHAEIETAKEDLARIHAEIETAKEDEADE